MTPPRTLERSLQRMWAGEGGLTSSVLGVATAPLSAIYGTAVRARNLAYDLGLLRAGASRIPVVSVGNLSAGGTGKTPVSAWLARELADRGWRPALVARGYGEDELALHRKWNAGIPVIRAPRRTSGIERAAAEGYDIAILDDGFQHRSARRDRDIVLLSPTQPLPPRVLPRGPYREPLGALRRADRLVVIQKGSEGGEDAARLISAIRRIPDLPPAHSLTLAFGPWTDFDDEAAPLPPGPPLAVCSIAQPDTFFRAVAARVDGVARHHAFPDHYGYDAGDAAELRDLADGRWLATTEKDAVKLVAFRELLPPVRVLPLVVTPDEGLADALLEGIGEPTGGTMSRGPGRSDRSVDGPA